MRSRAGFQQHSFLRAWSVYSFPVAANAAKSLAPVAPSSCVFVDSAHVDVNLLRTARNFRDARDRRGANAFRGL